MELKLYNTLRKKEEEFKPLNGKKVGLYTCGPTVYNFAHIGNLRTYVFEDILKRVLLFNNYKVKHVMNITDVGHLTSDADVGEDKMEKGAKREGKTAWEIAKFYENEFRKDIKDLNILEPDIWCRATEHIKEQIKLVKELEKKGYTYKTSDGIYFDTSKLDDYGKLANLEKQDLQAGVRVEMGEKKNPTDFALWKFSKEDEKRQMEWESPWGKGFPGWHIECSAMSMKYLGKQFDIHCGGIDHIPVHHSNEIAQSECVTGKKPWVKYWLHGEFLLTGSQKMAKSGENFLTMQQFRDKGINPLAYRYFLLQTHYRKQLNFSFESIEAAQSGLRHLYSSIKNLKENKTIDSKDIKEKFVKAVNDDLNIPNALALLWEALKDKKVSYKTVLEFDKVLGLQIKENVEKEVEPLPDEVKKIMKERDEARNKKEWEKSDKLRDELEKKGYEVKDTKEGTQVELK